MRPATLQKTIPPDIQSPQHEGMAGAPTVLRRYQYHTSILTDQAQACIPVPAPGQTHLSPMPRPLTPIHAEVALGADGLDEAVRPAVKGMAKSCGPKSGKGSQCCPYPLCSSGADREAKDSVRDGVGWGNLSQACPVLFPLPQIQGCRSRGQRWQLHPHPS